ncbi:TetR/AcrR family transcriptional regulator [Speluncibacter jeojiensis]|uniref:TetR/AcrR family transcriptional regulator n=1 Tax=Speluncibacter jeojiensis TaxID=2710754 RepID=UPI00240F1301|nr:TetR/AcrR family transcriptional regulator [Rhodococcus sp. D2-41]
MTRQQAQAQTREHLLTTAAEHFLDRGYAAASLDQIADVAGYSKGAVYSNFANKDELCLAVLDRIRLEKMAEIVALLAAEPTLEESFAAFSGWADRTIGDRRWTLLEIEFSVRSRHNEAIRRQLAEGAQGVRAAIATIVTGLADRHGLHCTLPAEEAATALLSLGIGLGLQRAISPELPAAALADTLRALFGL